RMDSSAHIFSRLHFQIKPVPSRCNVLFCRSALVPAGGCEAPLMKVATVSLSRSYNAISGGPIALQLIPALGIIGFAIFGLEPLMRLCRALFLQEVLRSTSPTIRNPSAYKTKAVEFCQIFFNRVYICLLFFKMSIDLIGKAVYTAIWVAAVSLFMELLGLSTQKWLTAGGMGTVLLSLAGREIFTNFLSSMMIHATRPFVVNERIKTKIKGYEVSGRVEHVGWWSPTIVRGADCEAVHIPNHKLSVNVVRNLSKKTHWRIKTHLAISHMDVNKINSIIADMRKVLAKNPLVEQKKLHRRVFLEDVNPENQALMILISCFVKTPHSEEYLRVKEDILLDLLKVISHHGARLATPIRTIQKMYGDPNSEIDPFDDAILTRSNAKGNRSIPFIDLPYKVKPSTQSIIVNGEKDAKIRETLVSGFKDEGEKIAATWTPSSSAKSQDKVKSSSQAKTQNVGSDNLVQKASKSGSTPKILLSSDETSPSKKDEEK
ncbi:hypothetical protein TSUD_304500, partial [Trifolium subterraneum]